MGFPFRALFSCRYLLLLSPLFAQSALAQILGDQTVQIKEHSENEITIGSSLGYLQNANVNSDEDEEELEQSLNASVLYEHNSSWLEADSNLFFIYVDYENDVLDDYADVSGSANLNLFLIPNRLSWVSSYTSVQSVASTLLAEDSNTTVTRTNIETGPELSFRLGNTDALLGVSYLHIDTKGPPREQIRGEDDQTTQVTDGSSKRYNYSLIFQRYLSRRTTLQFGGYYSDVFEIGGDDSSVSTFVSSNYQVGLARELKYGLTSLYVGTNSVEREDGTTTDGTFLGLSTNLQFQNTSVFLGATKALTDTSLGLSISAGFTGRLESADTNNFGSSDVVERERLEVRIQRTAFGGKGGLTFGAATDKEDYQIDALDSEIVDVNVGVDYNLTPYWNIGVTASYLKTDYIDQPQFGIDKDYDVRLKTEYEFTSQFRASMTLAYSERKNDEEILVGEDAVDNRDFDQSSFSISVEYDVF